MPTKTRKSEKPAKEKKSAKGKEASEKPAREKWVSPPIKTINEGKYDDYVSLYDNFNLPDLVAYCKEEGLKSTGKKKDVINRILNYRSTGEKEEPGESKKRKRSASRSKSPAKKSKTSSPKKEKNSSKEATAAAPASEEDKSKKKADKKAKNQEENEDDDKKPGTPKKGKAKSS